MQVTKLISQSFDEDNDYTNMMMVNIKNSKSIFKKSSIIKIIVTLCEFALFNTVIKG